MISLRTVRTNIALSCAIAYGHKICEKRYMETGCNNEHESPSDFENSYASSHIQISPFQRLLLTAGSATISLCNPMRADMIAILSETTGTSSLQYMLNKMKSSTEGKEILRNKPRINSRTVDLQRLQSLPEGTLGREYVRFLNDNKVTPDSRLPVQFVDDVQLAFVLQRYREVHDLFHTLLGMPTNMLGEVTVKWVEALQTRQPMCVGGALFGSLRLAPRQRKNYVQHYLPWAIRTGSTCSFLMNVYIEQRWEQPLKDLHSELNIVPLEVS